VIESINILAIDPGTTKCGMAILNLNHLGEISLLYAATYELSKELKPFAYLLNNNGSTAAKHAFICKKITELFEEYTPLVVGSEIPYWNPKFPAAYGPLMAIVGIIQNCALTINPGIYFEKIPAAIVKSNLKVKGNSGDKSLMLEAIKKRSLYYDSINLNDLGPDSVDAIAVGLCICDMLNAIQ
jgi:Holliday junction resolvasome RuvABC endonuclease subunit